MNNSSTIAAISTALSPSAIGVIRISGNEVFEITEKIFDRPLKNVEGYKAVYGNIHDGDKIIDTVIATVFKAPHSYTGEDTVEISCHGSPHVLNRVLDLLVKNGAKRAGRGEFSKRAFVNGKMDLTRAEAVIDLIEAQTDNEILAARAALDGKIAEKVDSVREKLISLSADILAYIDYPDEDIADTSSEKIERIIDECISSVRPLENSFKQGIMIKNGVKTVICGKPNAGKSMLMNRILGCERSIVTSAEGTTRDVVSEYAILGGIKLDIRDTAGIRSAEDEVEKIGIDRASEEVKNADLVLFVFDLSRKKDENDLRILELLKNISSKKIAVLNKMDIEEKNVEIPRLDVFDKVVKISAKDGSGSEELEKAVKECCENLNGGSEIIMNARQHQCLEDCLIALENAKANSFMTPDVLLTDIEQAIDALGSLTGKTVSEQIIENIFERFCVGK